MSGKGSGRRPAAYVPRCRSTRHTFLPGRRRCVCGKRRPPSRGQCFRQGRYVEQVHFFKMPPTERRTCWKPTRKRIPKRRLTTRDIGWLEDWGSPRRTLHWIRRQHLMRRWGARRDRRGRWTFDRAKFIAWRKVSRRNRITTALIDEALKVIFAKSLHNDIVLNHEVMALFGGTPEVAGRRLARAL